MSKITLTELAKKRMMGEGLPSRVAENGDVLVRYNKIVVELRHGQTYAQMFAGKDCIASFDPVILSDGSSLTIDGLEGELRVHVERPMQFRRVEL